MLNRFGFALAILLFGCLLFGIGYLWNNDAPISDIVHTEPTQDATSGQASEERKPEGMASAGQGEENNEGPVSPNLSVLPNLSDLFLDASTPVAQRYTLMLGQFTSQKLANNYAEEVRQPDSDIIQVAGDESMNWWLVISGNFSLAEATRAAYDLKAVYDRDSAIIKLPAKPES